MKKASLFLLLLLFSMHRVSAQDSNNEDGIKLENLNVKGEMLEDSLKDDGKVKPIAKLKYIKQPGLAHAASKIYSADERWSISGFGEINYVNYRGPKTRGGDLELYYTNLYRSGTFFGYKITDRFIFNSELQLELLHDGIREFRPEFNLELMFDVLINPYFNIRFGNYPLPIGYVNVNEEPIAFYTVNRPEVERIIIPTQWLEPGFLFYGTFLHGFEYNLGLTKGLDATDFREGSWIRQGRFHFSSWPKSVAFNGKLEYSGVKNLLVGLSGYNGDASNGHYVGEDVRLTSRLSLMSSFAEYNISNLSFFGLLSRGWLTGTDQLYDMNNVVIGSETLGYYGEVRWDILHYFNNTGDWKLPLFVRYERLNTHAAVHPDLENIEREENNLSIISVGLNARPKRNITFKANYQIRTNKYAHAAMPESNRFEVGLGFIF
jgi:hypothetical protein